MQYENPAMEQEKDSVERVRRALGQRSVVLVGLMGCGKSSIGKRLATRLSLPFVDADEEIERVAQKSISEIFSDHGEEFFRDRESKVISRLLATGPQVLATGGGAFITPGTREKISEAGISIWLRAELSVLMRRVGKRDTRPLLKGADPEGVMRNLMEVRYPVYAEADLTIESREVPHDTIVTEIVEALARHLALAQPTSI
ncbi:MAG TPA: shikimate kinase [Hyphomicrobium sp.]|nr:shikimate kinase [Hyphomicrobium sp.]